MQRRGTWHVGLAAARRARLRLRSDVPAGRWNAYIRRDGPRREASHQSPRGGLPPTRRGVFSAERAMRRLGVSSPPSREGRGPRPWDWEGRGIVATRRYPAAGPPPPTPLPP